MATAKIIPTPPLPQPPPEVHLTLTMREAEVLYRITHMVAGHPSGPRGDVDAISAALADAGVEDTIGIANAHGSIYF